jgi:hypothetical protein
MSLPKLDAVYYNNPNIKTIDSAFLVNPAFEEPILKILMGTSGLGGQLDFSDLQMVDDWVQYTAIIAKAGTWINDRIMFAKGDSKQYPALRKAKAFGWGLRLSEDDFLALNGSGPGATRIKNKIMAETQVNRARMQDDMLRWCIGTTTTFSSEVEYDPHWLALLANKGATGTPSNPEDVQSTAGTTTAYATNLTGTNKSKDFVLNSFGKAIKQFTAQFDSTSRERMLKPAGNDFTCFMHPDAIVDLGLVHPYNGVQDDQAITIKQQIAELNITLVPTYYVDATYDNSEDGTIDFVTCANLADNFKIGTVVPYTVTDWYDQVVDGIRWHYKTAYQKVIPVIRPFYISGSWKKAMHHGTFVYMNDA